MIERLQLTAPYEKSDSKNTILTGWTGDWEENETFSHNESEFSAMNVLLVSLSKGKITSKTIYKTALTIF